MRFTFNGVPTDSFRVREGDAEVSIEATRGTHGEEPAEVDVVSSPGGGDHPASFADYDETTKTLRFVSCCETDFADIEITDDTQEEPLETATFNLKNATNRMIVISPSEALLTIVDNDGPSRVHLERDEYSAFESNETRDGIGVDLRLLRAGNMTQATTVTVSTESGTAVAGQDFTAVDRQVTIPSGEWSTRVRIPFNDDRNEEGNETFDVSLEAPGQPTTSATITILDNDGNTITDYQPPVAAFHHPLHGKRYFPGELKTLYAFMSDDFGGSGIKRVDLAIKMNMDNGSCKWWTGSRFRSGSCTKKRWASMGRESRTRVTYHEETAVFSLDKKLRSSGRRADIKNYIAYCRAIDNAGNVQDNFYKKQNRNTFEVRRS